MSSRALFLIEKAISLSLVAFAVFFLSSTQILMTFVILGQGHFFIAYLYQYRAGKISKKYVVLYFFALALSLIDLLYFKRLDLLVVTAGVIFLIHFLQDELFLARKKASFGRLLEMIPPLVLYAGFLLQEVMRIEVLPQAAFIALAVLIIYGVYSVRARVVPDLVSAYFLALTALLLGLFFFHVHVPIRTLIGALVLLHYSTWYIQYFFKVRENPERLRSYIRSVLACNLIAVALYLLFLTPFGTPWLFVLFTPGFFYIWTMQHILFSIRWGDWRGLLKA